MLDYDYPSDGADVFFVRASNAGYLRTVLESRNKDCIFFCIWLGKELGQEEVVVLPISVQVKCVS